jgi:outer membrane autotransporter protein
MDETNNLSPDQTVEVGLLTPTLQVGNTLRLSDNATVEPWAGAALDWTFISQVDVEGVGDTNDPYVDLRLQGGLNFVFGTNMQLSLTGEIGGLIADTIDTYSGEANLAIQF